MFLVKDCMARVTVNVKRGTPLKEILKILRREKCRQLTVVDSDNRITGEITLKDILTVFQPHTSEITQLLETVPFLDTVPEVDIDMDYISSEMAVLIIADDIMTTRYLKIAPESSVSKAYSMMKVNNRDVLLVADEQNRLLGTIEMFDIIYKMFKEKGVVD
ncbi:HPP family protein [Elusimicrobiota bacterium]